MEVVGKIISLLHLLNCFFLVFALFLSYLTRFGFTFEDLFAVFVQFESSDNHLAGVNAHVDSCAISFISLHPFNVDDIFLPINLHYFANLLTFVVSSHNLNFIILSDGHGPNIVFLSQLLGKRGRHNLSANVGRCIEMPFAVFAPVRSHKGIELHFGWKVLHSFLGSKSHPMGERGLEVP